MKKIWLQGDMSEMKILVGLIAASSVITFCGSNATHHGLVKLLDSEKTNVLCLEHSPHQDGEAPSFLKNTVEFLDRGVRVVATKDAGPQEQLFLKPQVLIVISDVPADVEELKSMGFTFFNFRDSLLDASVDVAVKEMVKNRNFGSEYGKQLCASIQGIILEKTHPNTGDHENPLVEMADTTFNLPPATSTVSVRVYLNLNDPSSQLHFIELPIDLAEFPQLFDANFLFVSLEFLGSDVNTTLELKPEFASTHAPHERAGIPLHPVQAEQTRTGEVKKISDLIYGPQSMSSLRFTKYEAEQLCKQIMVRANLDPSLA